MEIQVILTEVICRRADGTFLGLVDGKSYHIIPGEQFWEQATAMGADAPLETLPPPPEPTVPSYVRKLALVRALRAVGLDGDPDNPVKAWPVIRAAIEAADDDTQEDWALAVEIPRDDPALAAIAGPLNVPAIVLDAVFILAAQIAG